jgi:hypothetical protein
MIHFKESAPQDALQDYEDQKHQLAKLPCVKRMVSGINHVSAAEEETREIMSRVTYPQGKVWIVIGRLRLN